MGTLSTGALSDGLALGLRQRFCFSLGFFLWAVMPYGLCLVGLVLFAKPVPIGLCAAVALLFDFLAHHAVFIRPTSSTAPLVLLFMPLWHVLLFVPRRCPGGALRGT